MNSLTIKTLTLENFKGIRSLKIDADGRDVSIYGENGVGKTTIADAYYWLLFGKDSLGRQDYEIKTVYNSGNVVHFLEHAVEAEFITSSGDTLTLRRIYKEDWATQRGSSTKSFKGHTTSYQVDGVPQSATEYAWRIADICDEKVFRLLTDATAFQARSWQDRREMVFDICGDMTDAEVIAADPELAELGKRIGKYSIADYRKVVDAQRSKTRDERTALPARIDEALRNLPAESNTNWESALTKAQATVLVLQNDRAKIAAGGKAAEIRSTLVDVDSKRKSIEADLRSRPNPAREAAIKARREFEQLVSSAQSKVRDLTDQVSSAKRRGAALGAELTEKRAQSAALKAKVFSGAAECPTCNRELPEAQVQSAIEEFNAAKAESLARIRSEGLELAAAHDAGVANLEGLQKDLDSAKVALQELNAAPAIIIPDDAPIDPATDPEWVQLGEDRVWLLGQLEDIEGSVKASLEEIDAKIKAAQSDVQAATDGIASVRQRKAGLVRVDELRAREKELSAHYEDLELSIYLLEQFSRAKVRLLTDRINSRFRLTTFRLFQEQINGGIKECCDVLWRENGAQPSNGQAVQIGLDIISTLSDHVGLAAPIFIDNSESVTAFPVTRGQQFRLIVSPDDPELRIVTGSPVEGDPFVSEQELTASLF